MAGAQGAARDLRSRRPPAGRPTPRGRGAQALRAVVHGRPGRSRSPGPGGGEGIDCSRWRSRSGSSWPSPPSRRRRSARTSAPKTAVRDLTLSVPRGEVFGFLGPNGAGKTTSIKMLLGLVHPTSGGGPPPRRADRPTRARARVGYLPEHFAFHEWLRGRELLRFHGRLLGLRGPSLEQSHRGAAPPGGAARGGRPVPPRVQQGHEAADRPRAGPPRRARARLPRRAHLRASTRSAASSSAT